jgi:fructosamine-3-kinase
VKVREAVASALAAPVVRERPLGGGSINLAYAVELADGRRVFVKTNDRAPADMYAREAEGLAWLEEAGVLRVPRVLAHAPSFLALELI